MFLPEMLLWLSRSGWLMLLHLSARSSFPKRLPAGEEAALLERMQAGDGEAANALIEHNLRLVVHIARKYAQPGVDQDDLVSLGALGLIKAVHTFRPEAGRLTAYASRCIENEIRMSLRTEKKLVGEVSMEEPLGRDREGHERTVLDLVGTDGSELFEEVSRRLEGERLRSLMDRTLRRREKLVLSLRCGLSGEGPLTQQQVADRIGISRSYISRIEKKAVLKLRLALLEEGSAPGKKDL